MKNVSNLPEKCNGVSYASRLCPPDRRPVLLHLKSPYGSLAAFAVPPVLLARRQGDPMTWAMTESGCAGFTHLRAWSAARTIAIERTPDELSSRSRHRPQSRNLCRRPAAGSGSGPGADRGPARLHHVRAAGADDERADGLDACSAAAPWEAVSPRGAEPSAINPPGSVLLARASASCVPLQEDIEAGIPAKEVARRNSSSQSPWD
jgi:hypothetical protein